MKSRGMALHWKILLGLVLGVALGVALNAWWTGETWSRLGVNDAKDFLAGKANPANDGAVLGAMAIRVAVRAAKLVADLFLRGLRFIAVPVILFSIISAVAGLADLRRLGRIGGKTLGIFALTVVIASGVGLVLVNVVRPGSRVSEETRQRITEQMMPQARQRLDSAKAQSESLSAWDQVTNALPTNPFAALAQGDMLQVVVAAILVGIGLILIPKPRRDVVVGFCDALADAVLQLVRLLMQLAPFAVFCLVVPVVAGMGLELVGALAAYCVTTLVGLGVVLFLEYPLLTRAFTPAGNKVGYRRFFRGMAPAQLLAFSSSSSAATLPATMECCNDRLGVPEEITSFVCPLGTTINMDGTALYQIISVIFLAQLSGVDLSWAQQATVALLAILVAVGAPGLPGSSVVMMTVVLQAVGLPGEGIAIILAVDRLLDMARTVVNVSGDAAAAVIVAGSEGRLGKDPLEASTAS
jgi:Na+/H+-dicarboxylate symporter